MPLFKKKKTALPRELGFRHAWRPYQKRVLEELEQHLDDDRLHVVAAPGAGKTVLGLEVIRRLDTPTLILSPTLTIRDQWLDRLEHLFLPEGNGRPDWLSTDVLEPKSITSLTYQALHMAVTLTYQALHMAVTGADDGEEDAEEEEEAPRKRARKRQGADVPSLLKRTGVKTVVLDECHHLRAEWWRTLTGTIDGLEQPNLVALTATPPYDVPPKEWDRYQELCGPVDTEISVPELVGAQNLCPHQDYAYLSSPSAGEKERLKAFRASTRAFLEGVSKDEAFIRAVESHPYLADPRTFMKEILDRVRFFSSIAVFLNHARGRAPKNLLKAMGLYREPIPDMTEEWWEELLSGCLYGERERFKAHDDILKQVERDLKRFGAIERRRVRLRSTKEIGKLLATSLSKMESIEAIVRLEHASLGEELRQVILTDFIRAADMPRGPNDEGPLTRIGVVPLFERLRREGPPMGIRLGILSGSLVVVPAQALPALEACAQALDIEPHRLTSRALPHDERFLRVAIAGADRKRLTRLVTDVFNQGEINVLVGTKSLLGEGWDAPSVNSLVLSSFVGSFMLSNQMRGRAIRVDPARPKKTANIWHPVCVEDEKGPSGEPRPGPDWETMTRRFKAFVGPSRLDSVIENGFERLALGDPPFTEKRIQEINEETARQALDREALERRWEEALGRGEGHRMVLEFETPAGAMPRGYVFTDAIKAAIREGFFIAGTVLSLFHYRADGEAGLRILLLMLAGASALAALASLPSFLKALWLTLRHGSVAGSLKQIGKALLKSLAHCEILRTGLHKMRVKTFKGDFDKVVCRLEGGTTYERSLFLDALHELLAPIDNPRYLLVRKSRLGWLARRDYHAVPATLGRRKEHAEHLARMWARHVGPVDLVYTRNEEGRAALLRARGRSLSSSFLKRSERRNRWR
jgi:superfamily II DNA or RNA helicase